MKSFILILLTLLGSSLSGQSFQEYTRYGVYILNEYYGFRGGSGEIVFPKASCLIPELYSDSGLVVNKEHLKILGISELTSDGFAPLAIEELILKYDDTKVILAGKKKSKMFWDVADALGQNFKSNRLGDAGQLVNKEIKGVVDVSLEATERNSWTRYVSDLYKLYLNEHITEKEFLIFSSPYLLQLYRHVNKIKLSPDLPKTDVDANFNQQLWSQLVFLIEVHPDSRVQREYGDLLMLKDQLIQMTEFHSSESLTDFLTETGLSDFPQDKLGFFRAELSDKTEYVLSTTPKGAILRKSLKL